MASLDAFAAWCASRDDAIEINDEVVTIERTSDGGDEEGGLVGRFRVVARARCATVGTILGVIPKSSAFTIHSSTLRSTLGSARGVKTLESLGEVGLVCACAYERFLVQRAEASAWKEYFDVVPSREDLPQFWEETSERRRALVGTKVEVMIHDDFERMQHDWSVAEAKLKSAAKYAKVDLGDFSWLTFDAFRDAASVVASRAFFVDENLGQGLLPFGDLFNHKSNNAHFHVVGATTTSGHDCVVRTTSTRTRSQSRAEQTSLDDHEDALALKSCREIAEGEEIYNSFGDDHDNSMLLYKYGFAERQNTVRGVEFPPEFWEQDSPFDGFSKIAHFHEWLNDNYECMEFEIGENGSLSPELTLVLVMASRNWLDYNSSEEELERSYHHCVNDIMNQEESTTSEAFFDITPEIFFAFVATRFRYYGCVDKYKKPFEAQALPDLFIAMVEDVRECRRRSQSSPGSSAVGGGVCGLSAAYLCRADEIATLCKTVARMCLSEDNEDEEDEEPVGKKPKLLSATPAYSPTVYLHKSN